MALTFGLWTGILRWLLLIFTLVVRRELVWYGRDFIWMSPISYSLVISPLALALAVFAVAAPRLDVRRIAIAVYGAYAAFGLLLPFSQISRYASLVLALGIGTSCARLLAHRQQVARDVPWHRLAFVSAAGVALSGIGMHAAMAVREHKAVASLPSADSTAPNVLLLILDTARAASMSLYGATEQTTPHLQRWARDGATFDWAFSTAPWTLPSHASMFTGRYGGGTLADWKVPMGTHDSTAAEYFRARGYATAGFVGNMQYTAWDSGLDRGFAHYEDYRISFAQLWFSSSYTQTSLCNALLRARSFRDVWTALRHPNLAIDPKHRFDPRHASDVGAAFLTWEQSRGTHPFFAFLNFMDAHQPYYAPATYPLDNPTYKHPHYDAALAYLDDQIDHILTTLEARRMLDNTVVVVAADHGELFGEHGLYGHAHNVYTNVLHVPLVIRFPKRVPAGVRIQHAVSLRDMLATVTDLAGLEKANVPGRSLAVNWGPSGSRGSAAMAEVSRPPTVNPAYPSARGPLQALFDDSLHYIRDGEGREELYTYRVDVLEATNLAQQPGSRPALLMSRTTVDEILRARRQRMLASMAR